MEYIILWILALFGLWSLVSNIIDSFFVSNMADSYDVVLNIHNKENTIELLIKQLSSIDIIKVIKVYDKGSTDNTVKVIKAIEKVNSKVVFIDEK